MTRRYRMAQEGRPSRHGGTGLYVLKPEAARSCSIVFPTWNKTHTVIRILPQRNPDNPQEWDPFCLSEDPQNPRDTGDWIRRYDMVNKLGDRKLTFIARDPADPADLSQHPVQLLAYRVKAAVLSGQGLPSWAPLVMSAGNKTLTPVRSVYLVQALVMEHRSVVQQPPRGWGRDAKTQIMYLKDSAGDSLMDKVAEFDPQGRRVCPDLVDLAAGKYVDFFQTGTPPHGQAAAAAAPQTLGGMAAAPLQGPGDGGFSRYEVALLDTFNGMGPSLAGYEEQVARIIKPWDDIIHIPTMEEQMHLICTSGLPASAIVYALGDEFRDLIPESIFQAARAERGPQTSGVTFLPGTPSAAAQSPAFPAGFAPPAPAADTTPPAGGAAPPAFAAPEAPATPAVSPLPPPAQPAAPPEATATPAGGPAAELPPFDVGPAAAPPVGGPSPFAPPPAPEPSAEPAPAAVPQPAETDADQQARLADVRAALEEARKRVQSQQ